MAAAHDVSKSVNNSILLPHEVEESKIHLTPPRVNDKAKIKTTSMYVSYGPSGGTLKIQATTPLLCPFGAQTFDGAGPLKIALELPENCELIAPLNAIDRRMLAAIVQHSEALYKKAHTEDEITTFFFNRRSVRYGEKEGFNPMLNIKIARDCMFFSPNHTELAGEPAELISLRCNILPIFMCRGITFVDKKAYPCYELCQAIVYPNEQLAGFSFRDVPAIKVNAEEKDNDTDDEVVISP